MILKFCGAAREVTGSSHLLTLKNGYTILLDCGLYQGRSKDMQDFNENFLFNPEEIDCVILSHAHIDHSGRLPKLVKDGFKGLIHTTHATRSLCSIMLLDSAKIQEYDARYENKKNKRKGIPEVIQPLYKAKHVKQTMNQFVTYNYAQWHRIAEGVEVRFHDAGHILGSSSVNLRIELEDGSYKYLGFTGDIGRPERPILKDPQEMIPADYLIAESTYGDRIHPAKPEEYDKFLNIIKHTCLNKKGKLIIPAFSIGRTQEIVFMLDSMANEGILPRIPIYVDSPLAVNATQIYGSHPECYDTEMHEYLLMDDNPFGFNTLQYVRDVEISKSLNNSQFPAIIISASGMMNAGRVKHHLFNNIEDGKNTVLIVGYAAPYTPAGLIRDGLDEIKLFGKTMKVNIEVNVMDSFSSHGDRNEMESFISNHKDKTENLFLVHGNYDAQQSYKNFLEEKGYKNINIPKLGDEFIL